MGFLSVSLFGAMQTAQRKWRNASGATQRNDETKPCKTRAKQSNKLALGWRQSPTNVHKRVKGLTRANYGVPQIDQS